MSDNKIVSLNGAPILAPGTPQPNVVAFAEWLLEAAKAGEITGVGAVLLWRDGATSWRLRGVVSYGLLGQTVQLQQCILEELK